jgi:phosphoglycolate phosphatase
MLQRLKRQGHRIYIVSSKPGLFARRIAYQFDLNLIFDEIFGAELKGKWQPKTDVLARLVQQGTVQAGDIFVGDRGDDMRAAKDHGLRAVGVTWGYGSKEELEEGGAEILLGSIPELDFWLREALPGDEIHDAFTRAE